MLFADDTSRFNSTAHIADIASIINHDLQLLTNWAKQWFVTFNPLKTETVLLTLKKLHFLPQLVFDNIPIAMTLFILMDVPYVASTRTLRRLI